MKTNILAGIIIAGALTTSAVQAAPSVEEIYSGMSAAAVPKDQQANPAAGRYSTAGKSTCGWHEAKHEASALYAAYPGDEYVEKAYFTPANQNFVC